MEIQKKARGLPWSASGSSQSPEPTAPFTTAKRLAQPIRDGFFSLMSISSWHNLFSHQYKHNQVKQKQLLELWEWEVKLSLADINLQSMVQGFLSILH